MLLSVIQSLDILLLWYLLGYLMSLYLKVHVEYVAVFSVIDSDIWYYYFSVCGNMLSLSLSDTLNMLLNVPYIRSSWKMRW